uniref:Nuclear receptor n=1 Tax=Macrostomum lignano TaxID=282301 RepID=A0A1I8II29_9PLAT
LSTVVRTRRRKAGLPEDERVCAVCGDPASGYNFDRLTCESCKAFFRRNALKAREKIKPCSRGGGCDVSGSQRKHCPTCRLEKCVRVGMKKELILPPEKLEQRAKPKKRAKNGGPPSDGPSAAHHGLSPAAPAAPPQPKRSAKAASSSHHHPQPSRQRCPSPSRSSPSLLDAQQPPESELALVWSAGTAAGRRWPRELTATDRECLASLAEALARARETLGSSSASADSASGASAGHRKDGVGRLEQAFNQMDACIRRIISVVKLIPIFSDVEKDSQILMLKVNIYGLVILYSSFFNNSTTPAGVSSSGGAGLSLMQELAASVSAIIEMRPDVSDLTPADLDQYRANTDNVYAQLERHSRRDDIVKMLMLALKLFNSDTMPAEVRGAIDEAQSVYSQLLKKYLACKFGVADAMRMYPRLLMTFIDMRTVENKMTEFTKLLSVESLNPLVREVTQVN